LFTRWRRPATASQLLQIPLPARDHAVRHAQPPRSPATTSSCAPRSASTSRRTPCRTSPRAFLVTVGGDLRGATQQGGRNWVLDMNPRR
jgi:hypothetical protein